MPTKRTFKRDVNGSVRNMSRPRNRRYENRDPREPIQRCSLSKVLDNSKVLGIGLVFLHGETVSKPNLPANPKERHFNALRDSNWPAFIHQSIEIRFESFAPRKNSEPT